MAKKGNSIADRLREWKEVLEDIKECRPEWLPDLFRTSAQAARNRAAEYFKLDPTDKTDSERLLYILSDVAFPKARAGRPKRSDQWGVDRLAELGRRWREVDRTCPEISDVKAAREIKKLYPKDYQSADVVRPRLPDARLIVGARGRGGAKQLEGTNGKKGTKELLNELGEAIENRHRLICIWLNEIGGQSRARRREALKKIPLMKSPITKALAALREIQADLTAKLPVK
jgi:hypothetical protein